MASGKHNFKLESGLPLKDMVAGLEKLMPVGSRQFTLVEPDGKDAAGNKKYKSTDLSALQDAIHKEDPNWSWEKGCFDEVN